MVTQQIDEIYMLDAEAIMGHFIHDAVAQLTSMEGHVGRKCWLREVIVFTSRNATGDAFAISPFSGAEHFRCRLPCLGVVWVGSISQ